MPAFTTNQWAVVVLVLVAGWLLGLMSRSGGAKWRRAYEEERESHLALRRDYEAHLQQHGMVSDTRIPPLDDRTIRRPI
ncbi:hypothetical protein D3Y57_16465 [Sphingomonas paeninsulae]|jgi:hypothetical protein|uniref:Uncharacterized protein n=1 Tax=Sphingomonas paeninsulae TaxID=2319844 RepID=A0A494TQ61_SPHPE|nr:hypothetical protein [Sphingomonas paeninsulae]AYJ87235.1 hypothetical protein D3Y57_16465 [Sphingomonas paeninsulae]